MCCRNLSYKMKHTLQVVRSGLMPNMNDIEEQRLYQFNLRKAWVSMVLSASYSVLAYLFSISQW